MVGAALCRANRSDEQYANLEDAMGHPSDPAGLLGCNCRHSFYPFWVGVSEPNEREPEPVAYNDREYTYYEATQKQRAMERDLREQGRVKNALAAQGEDVSGNESLIRQKKDEYERFSSAMDIRPKWERCWVPGDKEVDWERVIGAGKTMSVPKASSVWPNTGKPISDESYQALNQYATEKGLVLEGFRKYDGDVALIRRQIGGIDRVMQDFSEIRKQKLRVAVSYDMSDDDFAITTGKKITFNGKALRDADTLEKEYQKLANDRWFVKGTTCESISYHEMGHAIVKEKQLSARKTIDDLFVDVPESKRQKHIMDSISIYASNSNGECIAELFSAHYSRTKVDDEVLKLTQKCVKMAMQR